MAHKPDSYWVSRSCLGLFGCRLRSPVRRGSDGKAGLGSAEGIGNIGLEGIGNVGLGGIRTAIACSFSLGADVTTASFWLAS